MNQEEIWNTIAEKWAEFRIKPLEDVKNFLKNKSGKILDLGCGSGRHFIEEGNLQFYGIDFSEKFLEIAKKKNYIELKKSETNKIPYAKNFFDFALLVRVLHCINSEEKRKETLSEIYRVLKKEGEVLISVWGRGQKRLKNKPKETFIPWTIEKQKIERYTYIYDKEELTKNLEDIGFKIIKIWEDECINMIAKKPISS